MHWHEWLHVTKPDYWWIDWFRYYVVFVGAACFIQCLLVLYRHRLSLDGTRKITVTGFGLFGAFATIQELDQLHQPVVVFRLPFLVVITSLFAISLWLHLRGKSTVPN